MGNAEKLPDSERFTKEVENVIDDLFTPVKDIEIDPLTNEVTEKAETAGDASPGPGEKEGEITMEPEGLEAPARENREESPGSRPGEEVLELDLELEMEEEEPQGPGGPTGEPPGEAAAETERGATGDRDILSELRQAVWTLEWEVTGESLRVARDILGALHNDPLCSDPEAEEIVTLMEGVLKAMERGPESMPTSAPNALKQGVEFLYACSSPEPHGDEISESYQRARSSLKAAHVRGMPTPQESRVAETREAAQEPKDLPEPPRAPKEVLDELKTCIERIRPVEALLARTRGMEKLHLFLGDLRKRLERQVEAMDSFMLVSAAPTPASAGDGAQGKGGRESETRASKAPWDMLVVARSGDAKLGFVLDEIAYEGTIPWWAGDLSGRETIPLKSLKPWPWSRLRGMFQGELASREESELAGMEIPVISPAKPESRPQKGKNIVILHKDSNTAAVFLDGATEHLELDEEHEFSPVEAAGYEGGEIKMGGTTLHVITVAKLSR